MIRDIKLFNKEISPSVSHNLNLYKCEQGYHGVARFDSDVRRTEFMKKIGTSHKLVEFLFDKDFKIKSKKIKEINGVSKEFKFEDYRSFVYNKKIYYCVSYIDKHFNTHMGLLDSKYKFLGKINTGSDYKISFVNNKKVFWEKNWLFFEQNNELYFVYSSNPNLVIYKCTNFQNLSFSKVVDTLNPFNHLLPQNELYFSSNTSTGGSTNPIYLKDLETYVYLIHTKIYHERKYNHFLIGFNKNFNITFINPFPLVSSAVKYGLMFVTSMIFETDSVILSGGIEDNQNFVYKIPRSRVKII